MYCGRFTVSKFIFVLFENKFSVSLNYTAFDICQRTLLFSKAGANVLLFFIRASAK
jgi:hypothetical protein